MKQILLLRHAKSSWENDSLRDFDRPLAKRGRKDAPLVGVFLKNTDNLPQRTIASGAKRARQTTDLVLQSAGIKMDMVQWEDELYSGSAVTYLEHIQQTEHNVERLLVVGHNPKIEYTISLLCGSADHVVARMPTATLVCIEHPAEEWRKVVAGTARIGWMVTPKLLKKGLL